MAVFKHLSCIYLNDDEFYELLSPKNIHHNPLLALARSRGLVFSDKCAGEDARARLALLPSDWTTVKRLLEGIARADPEEHKASCHIAGCDKNLNIPDLAGKVRDARKSSNETFNITQVAADTTKIDVTYIDLDYSRSQVYQRRERKCSIEITKTDNGVSFMYNACSKGKAIVHALKGALKSDPKQEKSIALTGIRDPALRTQFFLNIISKMSGYKLENATDINVNRRLPEVGDADDNDGTRDNSTKPSASKAKDEIKSCLNKIALTGEQLLSNEIYQQVAQQGYYISKIAWTACSEADAQLHIDCMAGFVEPVAADEFTFDVIRRWKDDRDARVKGRTVLTTTDEKRVLNNLLKTTAFKSFDEIVTQHQKPGKNITHGPLKSEELVSTRITCFNIEGIDRLGLSPLLSGMAREMFGRRSTAGFMVDKQSSRTIEGRYIRKLSFMDTFVDPFGDKHEVTTIEFVEQRFIIGLSCPQLVLFNSSASAKALLSRISEFTEFRIAVSPVEISPDRVYQEFCRLFDNVRVYAAVVQDIKLSATALVQLRFQSSDDVRVHVRRFLKKRKVDFDTLKIEFDYSGQKHRAEISNQGQIQLYGEYDPTLRDTTLNAISTILTESTR